MALDKKSIYALNKKEPNKIIYPSVTNAVHYLELKDGIVTEYYIDPSYPDNSYQMVSLEITADTFRTYKKLSDEDYHETENLNQSYNVHKVSSHNFENTVNFCTESAMDILFKPYEEQALAEKKALRKKIGKEIWDKLTPIQKRRYLNNKVNHLSTYEMAALEGVEQNAVWESLVRAERKIKKNLKKFLKTTG